MTPELRRKLADAYLACAQHLQSPMMLEAARSYDFARAARDLRDEIRKLRVIAGVDRDSLLVDVDDLLGRLVPMRASDAVQIEGLRKRIALELVADVVS